METRATTTSVPDSHASPGRPEREAARARAAELFSQHTRMVQGLCRGLLRDRADAEDAAQQTFLSAYRALLRGSEPLQPAAWLAAIARNECLARIRAAAPGPYALEDVPSVAPDPLADAIRRADLAALWAALAELPPAQREALLLREFGGLSYGELAVALGVSRPAVESLLFRARSALRARVRDAAAALAAPGWAGALQDVAARLVSGGAGAKAAALPVIAKAVFAGAGIALLAGGAVTLDEPGPPRHQAAVPIRRHVESPRPAASAARRPHLVATANVPRPPAARQLRTASSLHRTLVEREQPARTAEEEPAPVAQPRRDDIEREGGDGESEHGDD